MNTYKKSFASLIILSIFISSLSPFFARKAEAQWVVWDPGNFVPTLADWVKEYGLDAVAIQIANKVIERMSRATVDWINGGFRGSPAYISNPESYFKNIGDQLAGQFIFSNPDLNFLCSPIRAKIKLALTSTYNRDSDRFQCRLSQVGKNLDNFVADFNNGGWDSFFTVSQTPGENPLGAYLQAEGQLFEKIANKQDLKKQELLQGNGFLSFKQCDQWENIVNPGQTQVGDTVGGTVSDDGIPQDTRPDAPQDTEAPTGTKRKCTKESTATPGSVISDQLNKTLGLGGDRLAAADEINEIVSALLNQLVGQVVGGIGRGLRGASKPSSTNNSPVFTDSLGRNLTQSPVVGYYCYDNETDPTRPYYDTNPNSCANPDTANTDALNLEPFDPNASPTGGTLVSPQSTAPANNTDPFPDPNP